MGDPAAMQGEVGGYRLAETVGQGPTGVVYRASAPKLEQEVALKLIHSDVIAEPGYRERLERDIHRAVQLDHPGLIPISDFGDDPSHYVVTRFVRGRDLGRLLSRVGRMDAGPVLSILEQTASALDAAHADGLVHGSMKPSNVMIAEATSDQRAGHVYVTDLAVARGMSGSSEARELGVRAPALEYASPEQIEGDAVTAATDQYALACVAYACLTGRPPFSRERDSAVMMAHLLEAPPSARSFSAELPEEADSVFERALAKVPSERFPTCGEFVGALGAVLRQEPPAAPPAPEPKAEEASRHSISGAMETEFRLGSASGQVARRSGETEFTPPRPGERPPAIRMPDRTPPTDVGDPAPKPPPAPLVQSSTPSGTELTPSHRQASPTPVAEPRPPAPRLPRRAAKPRAKAAGAPGARRVPLLVGGAVALAALVVLGIVLASRSDPEPVAAIAPAPKADRLALAGKQLYVVPTQSLLKNDRGESLRVVGLRGGKTLHGRASLDRESSRVVYLPDGGYTGAASFTYTVRDANGNFGVAKVDLQVRGLTRLERDLVALVPKRARSSCEATRGSGGPASVRCSLSVGAMVLRSFGTSAAASKAFAREFRAGEGDCASTAATGTWVWPGESARRGRFGCTSRSKRARFGWTYPTSRPFVFAAITGKTGSKVAGLSRWFFGGRLPRPA